jgi:hypothetical protein
MNDAAIALPMPPHPPVHRVVFRPARNDAGVNCRLPNGEIAFPARFYWRDAAPQAYEVWEVAECVDDPRVGYVKPLRRLAEAPLGQSAPAHVASAGLLAAVTLVKLAGRLLRRLAPCARDPTRASSSVQTKSRPGWRPACGP